MNQSGRSARLWRRQGGSPTRRDLQLTVLTQTFDRTEVDFPNDVLWLFCTHALAANEDSLLRLIIYDNAAHLMHRHKVLIKSSAAPFISPPPAAVRAMEPFYHNEPGAERGKDGPPEKERESEKESDGERRRGGSNQTGLCLVA